MSRADYAHWNEDADYMWWHEEGKHAEDDAISAWENRHDDEYYDDGYECTNAPTECMENGNYNHEHDDVWSCSSCGTQFRKVSDEPYVMTPIV